MNPEQPPTYSSGPTPPPPGMVTSDDTTWAVIAHLAPLFGYFLGIGHIIIPLVIMLVKGPTSPFVQDQAKESLNFQISMTIYFIVAAILTLVIIGIFVAIALGIFGLVVMIQAAIAASKGEYYRYPATIRLIP